MFASVLFCLLRLGVLGVQFGASGLVVVVGVAEMVLGMQSLVGDARREGRSALAALHQHLIRPSADLANSVQLKCGLCTVCFASRMVSPVSLTGHSLIDSSFVLLTSMAEA